MSSHDREDSKVRSQADEMDLDEKDLGEAAVSQGEQPNDREVEEPPPPLQNQADLEEEPALPDLEGSSTPTGEEPSEPVEREPSMHAAPDAGATPHGMPSTPAEDLGDEATTPQPEDQVEARNAPNARRIPPEQIERARVLIDIYRREATTAPAEAAARILCVVARLYEDVFGDPKSAWEVLQEAVRRDPASPALAIAAFRMMVEPRNHHQASILLSEVADATDSIPLKVSLLLDLAAFQEMQLGSDKEAAQTYQRVLQADPGNLEAAESLLQLHMRNERWEEVARTCSQLADSEEDPETRFALLVTAALLTEQDSQMDRVQLAVQALETNQGADFALAFSLATLPERQDWEEMVRVLQRQIDVRPERSALLYFLMSRVQAARLGQMRNAIDSAEQAYDRGPKDLVYLDWLADLYRKNAQWSDLVEVLRSKMGLVGRAEELVEILVSLADIWDTRLNRPEKAIEELEAALAISPSDIPVLQCLGSLYVQTERWEDLVKMHLGEASVSKHPGRGAKALYRCACILVERLDRREAAIAHLEQAILLENDFGPAIRLLEELYRKEGRFRDLLVLYQEQFKNAPTDSRKIELLEHIALVLDSHLGEIEKAKEAYLELLRLQPSHLVATNALVQLYEKTGEYPEMLSTMRSLVDQQGDPKQKAATLNRMGQIFEENMREPAQALAHYQEALGFDPGVPELYQHVGRLLHAGKQWQDLVDLYQKELEVTDDVSDRVRLLFRIGRLQEQFLEQPILAGQAYRQALQIEPSYWPAVRGILRVARQNKAFQEVAELETRLLGELPPDTNNAPALVRVGLMLDEEAGPPLDAEPLFWKALEEDPDNQLARMLLLRSLVRRMEWDKVTELLAPFPAALVIGAGTHRLANALETLRHELARGESSLAVIRWLDTLTAAVKDLSGQVEAKTLRIERETDIHRRTAVQYRLGAMAEWGSADISPEEVYRDILKTFPEEGRVLDALARFARKKKDNHLLLEVLRQQSEVATTPARRSLVLSSLADLLMIMDQQEEAVQAYRQALEGDPCCRTAYDTLRGLYWQRGDKESLGWVLETGLDSVTHPDTLSVDLILRSDIRMEKGDTSGALADLDRALSVKPAMPSALERIDRVLREQNDFNGLVERLERAAEQTQSSGLKSAIYLQIGLIYLDELDNLRDAETYLGLSINANPDNAKALLAAANLRVKMDQPTEAMVLLSRVVLRTRDEEDLFQASLDIARICRDILGDPVRARASLEAILVRDPEHLPALRQMAELARQLKDETRREEALRKLSVLEDEPSLRARYLVELSDHLGSKVGWDSPEVLESLEQAIALQPARVDLLQRLVDLYRSAGRWEAVDRVLLEHIQDLSEQDRPVYLLMRGTILTKYLDRREEGRAVLEDLLVIEPDNEQAAQLLLEDIDTASIEDPDLIDKVISLHRIILKKEPRSVRSIRALYTLCPRVGRTDESFCAGSCLVLLGEASEEEAYFQKQRRRKLPVKAIAPLPPNKLDELALPQGDHPVRALLVALRPYTQELLPVDLGQYGISSMAEERLPPDHPTRQAAQYCADLLGVADFEVLEALGGVPRGTVEPGAPTHLLLPRDFLSLPVPAQRFLCGRLLTRVAVGTESFDPGRQESLAIRDLEILVAALLRTSEPQFGEEVAPRAILDDMTERIRETLPPAVLDVAVSSARALLERRRQDLPDWIPSTELGASIGGLICCGDVMSAWEALKRTSDRPLSESTATELVRFTTSGEFAHYRHLMGLALKD